MTEQRAASGKIAVAKHVERLRQGAEAVRSGSIDHALLVELVANWIDAEALLWETTEQFVELVNTLKVESETRGGEVRFGTDDAGELQCQIDTSEHALKIIAAASGVSS